MGKGEETTNKLNLDISEFKAGIQEANRQIRLAASEFKAASANMENWGTSAEGLSAKIKQLDSSLAAQSTKLDLLKKQYQQVSEEQGENSKAAQELLIKINNQQAAVSKVSAELNTYKSKLAEVNQAGEKTEDTLEKLKQQENELNRQMKLATSEFKAVSAGMEDWETSTEGLGAKTKELYNILFQQNAQLDNLEQQLAIVAKEYGENSEAADNLKIRINNTKEAIGKTQKEIKKYEQSLKSMANESDDTEKDTNELGDEVKDLGEQSVATSKNAISLKESLEKVGNGAANVTSKINNLASKLVGGIAKGVKVAAVGVTGLVTAFLATGEASQETIEDMGKLETAFKASGYNAEVAQRSYKDMVGILGETDQSVEAVSHLAKLTNSEKELAQWTDIAAGIYGTFGDSLPLEGLTEAANETAKVGQVTGPLADALNWASVSAETFGLHMKENTKENEAFNNALKEAKTGEDLFNIALSECNTEAERSALITNTLNGLYGQAAEEYKKTNSDLINARKAQSDLNLALSETGKLAMPVMTTFKQMGANLLTEFIPNIKEVRDSIMGIFAFEEGADLKLQQSIITITSSLLSKFSAIIPSIGTIGTQIILALINAFVISSPQLLSAVIAMIYQIILQFTNMSPTLMASAETMVKSLVDTFVNSAPWMLQAGINLIATLINGFITMLPTFAQTGMQMIIGLKDAIIENLPTLLAMGSLLITMLVDGIVTYTPVLLQSGADLLISLSQGIMNNLPQFASKALDVLNGFADFLSANLPILIQMGILVITNLVTGLMNSLPTFISKAPEIISKFANIVNDNMPTILKAGINIIITIVKGIINAIPTLVANIPKIIQAFVDVWTAFNWLSLGTKAITLLKDGIMGMLGAVKTTGKSILDGITNVIKELPSKLKTFGKNAISDLSGAIRNGLSTVKSAAANIAEGIVTTISEIPRKLVNVGRNLVEGLWNGISDMTGWIVGKIQGFGDSVLGGIKKFFGIASPSKLMRDKVGKWIPAGVAEGIRRNTKTAVNAVKKMGKQITPQIEKVKTGLEITGTRIRGGVTKARESVQNVYNFYQTNNSPKALSRLEIYRQTRNQLRQLQEVG